MLGIQERCDHGVQTHGLTLLGGSGHKQMGSIRQVKHLHFLMDSVADRDRELSLAVPEGVVIEDGAHGHYRWLVVGDLDTYGVGQCHDADSPGMEIHTYVFLKLLDLGDFHAWCGIDFVQGDSRSHDGLHVVNLDTIVLQRRPDLVVVPGQLLFGDFMAAGGIFLEKFEGRELVLGQLVADVDRLKLLGDLSGKFRAFDYLQRVLLLLRFLGTFDLRIFALRPGGRRQLRCLAPLGPTARYATLRSGPPSYSAEGGMI